MHPTKSALIEAVRTNLRHVRQEIAPQMDRRPEPEFKSPEVRGVNAAQNTLRTCLEVCFQELMPFSELTCTEFAIRLASYAISAAPLEQQDQIMATVLRSLPGAHSKRLASGVIIQTDWETNGHKHPNVPGGRA